MNVFLIRLLDLGLRDFTRSCISCFVRDLRQQQMRKRCSFMADLTKPSLPLSVMVSWLVSYYLETMWNKRLPAGSERTKAYLRENMRSPGRDTPTTRLMPSVSRTNEHRASESGRSIWEWHPPSWSKRHSITSCGVPSTGAISLENVHAWLAIALVAPLLCTQQVWVPVWTQAIVIWLKFSYLPKSLRENSRIIPKSRLRPLPSTALLINICYHPCES
jgi:hypothetical protein